MDEPESGVGLASSTNGTTTVAQPEAKESEAKCEQENDIEKKPELDKSQDKAAPSDPISDEGKLGDAETVPSAAPSVPTDPNIGRIFERLLPAPDGSFQALIGTVVDSKPQQGRNPALWTVHYRSPQDEQQLCLAEDWLNEDLGQGDADVPMFPKEVLNLVEQRYQELLRKELDESFFLSDLFIYAALEEALHHLLQRKAAEETEATGDGTSDRKSALDSPPKYYSTNPSSYLQPPSNDIGEAGVHNPMAAVATPAALLQRIRSGSQWAWSVLQSMQPRPPAQLTAGGQVPRRTQRQTKPVIPAAALVPRPLPVQRGGRVAVWWLDELQNETETKESDTKESEEEKQEGRGSKDIGAPKEADARTRTNEDLPTPKKLSPKKKAAEDQGDEYVDALEEYDLQHQSEDDDEVADDDYTGVDEEEEEEELEDVEVERGRLSPLPKPKKKGTKRKLNMDQSNLEESIMEEEVAEEEDVDNEDVAFSNSHLKPCLSAFLEYSSRPRSFTPEEVQKAVCAALVRVKFNRRTIDHGLGTDKLASYDEVVMSEEVPDFPDGTLALKCVSGESYSDLQKMDAQEFSKCKFSLDVVGEIEPTRQVLKQQQLLAQEAEFKQRKAWDRYRYKGIHEGLTVWPSWETAASSWISENMSSEAPVEREAVPNSASQPSDEDLAKTLEAAEDDTVRRRTTRRGGNSGATDGVFYGNQSQLTQKQLMDAHVRLIKNSTGQTLFNLQAQLADDSVNPIKRARVSLGRLLWKRNQIRQMLVSSTTSDGFALKHLSQGPLLLATASSSGEEGDQDADDLVQYLREIQRTELHLRRLILKQLTDIPVPLIATAADERVGMESMDAADFDDLNSIDWLGAGHPFLGKRIYRPSLLQNTSEMTPCRWYRIQDYSPSLPSEAVDDDDGDANVGVVSVQRRMRFRAVPEPDPNSWDDEKAETILLTEAQVNAGLKAAEIQSSSAQENDAKDSNPFADGRRAKVSLFREQSSNESSEELHGQVVGHDTVVLSSGLEKRILILLEGGNSGGESFWATLVDVGDAVMMCRPVERQDELYRIEQFDYDTSSHAFQQCQSILDWLVRQPRAGPFMEPVDPVALQIPDYPNIIKNPMDISTLQSNLENGKYSKIPAGQTTGRSPVTRMLNGPFRKDLELIFDNAMLYNPPEDWIHQAAAYLKKHALKRLHDASAAAELSSGRGRLGQKRSVYYDDDSDVDMYEYESDNDDEFQVGNRSSRKRNRKSRGAKQDDCASRAIEHAVRLQITLRDTLGLRGPFANLPIEPDVSCFGLTEGWRCRRASAIQTVEAVDESSKMSRNAREMAELLELQRQVGEAESAGLRRSTRAAYPEKTATKSSSGGEDIEYYEASKSSADITRYPRSRLELEIELERRHEDFYAKLYQMHSSNLKVGGDSGVPEDLSDTPLVGTYTNGSFPPYLGRVVFSDASDEAMSWQIRSPLVVPAVRWVLRGLINSGHLTAIEPLTADSLLASGVILPNNVYYWDPTVTPFEVLDLKELQRKKRSNDAAQASDSDDDVELSEYERLRAERVARNAERLKALGLA